MPRYLVTLRHTETGETTTVEADAEDADDAFAEGEYACDYNYSEGGAWLGGWIADHACPADDPPIPGRD